MLRPTALVVVPLLLLGPGCTTKAELSTPERANGAAAATASPRVGAERNETDEAYVHELSAMHQQAISMSVMVANKQVPASLRDLAAEIGESRSEELRDLTGILARWDVKPHGADFHGNPGELTARESPTSTASTESSSRRGGWTGWPPTTGPPWRCRGPRSTGG